MNRRKERGVHGGWKDEWIDRGRRKEGGGRRKEEGGRREEGRTDGGKEGGEGSYSSLPCESVFSIISDDKSRTVRLGLWKYMSALCFSLFAGTVNTPSSEIFSNC